MAKFDKQIITVPELERMLAKHSGEHGEKVFVYGMAALLIVIGACATTWNWLLWTTSGIIQYMLLPVAAMILALAAVRRIFNLVIERLPGNGGAGR